MSRQQREQSEINGVPVTVIDGVPYLTPVNLLKLIPTLSAEMARAALNEAEPQLLEMQARRQAREERDEKILGLVTKRMFG